MTAIRKTSRVSPPTPPAPERPVRVMTFNLKAAHASEELGQATPAERERNLQAIAAFIKKANPDVVMLQEVEQNFARGGKYPMFERLQELLGATDGAMSGGPIG